MSDIKFETINGTLCQMVEPEPEPKERPLRNLILRAKEQGMNIRTWYQDLIFTPESLTFHLNNGKYRWWNIGDWELTKREANMPMPEPRPKPLLADAKVGDLCKTDLDEWIQIDDTSEPPSPILYHFDRPFKGNIIHTEPLAPEGSAEWAWQMLKLGKTVYNPSYYYTSSHGLITPDMLGNCSKQSFVDWQEPSGWQLCKPKFNKVQGCDPCSLSITDLTVIVGTCLFNLAGKGEPSSFYFEGLESDLKLKLSAIAEHKAEPIRSLEPAFKVGDWVEFRDIEGIKHGMVDGIQEEYSILYAGVSQSVGKKFILRKLSPFEVIIHIGCLSGTVSMPTPVVFYLKDTSGRTACIPFSMLDAPTRELVESLLKAQEESCHS